MQILNFSEFFLLEKVDLDREADDLADAWAEKNGKEEAGSSWLMYKAGALWAMGDSEWFTSSKDPRVAALDYFSYRFGKESKSQPNAVRVPQSVKNSHGKSRLSQNEAVKIFVKAAEETHLARGSRAGKKFNF